ncbi:RimK family alpha-L-glutamate ligase [Mycolicibacterium sp. GCM10028919]|uniref:ATP-grasp domain-containing protein n=1 Tax=Mycolicibacterium sp. GCM10028919 TaxID=3273401 RepID=UPI00361E5865
MKLARPDVRHPRIVFAGCKALVEGDGDDAGLAGALRTRGLHARWLAWDDPETERADLVILRATWDYTDRLDEFLAWTRRVPNLLNGPDVVAWNSDKRYLDDLATAGVPTVPSLFFAPGDAVRVPDGEVVVKPAVGAGSVGAGRFTDPEAAQRHAASLQASGRTALVQPYDPRIEAGETALVFLAGQQSHAFTKGPLLPPPGSAPPMDESGTYAEESLRPAEPDFELWAVGHAALAAAADRLGRAPSDFLYARVDVIGERDDPRLLELELVEPSLGWRQLNDEDRGLRQREFALAVESALDGFGLGPLSHRRP